MNRSFTEIELKQLFSSTENQDNLVEQIQDWLIEQLCARLELAIEDIDLEASFASYGLSSAQALVLLNHIENWLGIRLSPTLFWNSPTLEAFSQRVAEEVREDKVQLLL